MDACVTSAALTQSSRIGLRLRTEVALKHAHKTALTFNVQIGEERPPDVILPEESRGE